MDLRGIDSLFRAEENTDDMMDVHIETCVREREKGKRLGLGFCGGILVLIFRVVLGVRQLTLDT